MTLQTLKIGKREFVILAKRDFEKLAAQARLEKAEDDYWTRVALDAEAKAKASGDRPIPFEEVERELDQRRETKRRRAASKRSGRR